LAAGRRRIEATKNEEAFLAVERVKSEITGKVWKLEVRPGDRIEEEQPLIIIESMKMEIPVLAPAAGVVKDLLVKEGDDVAEGQDIAIVEL
jgi:acetyl-CoA carboxylase biotin carboxyl carrier protein